MKKQILSLIQSFYKSLTIIEFLPHFAACCMWVKMSESNELDDTNSFSGTASNEKLHDVINNTISCQYGIYKSTLSDDELSQLMNALQRLIRAKAITYKDLSDAIKEMLANEGKGNEVSIPEEVCQLGVALLDHKDEDVYLPFNAGYLFAHKLPEQSLKSGETKYSSDVFYAEAHNVLIDCKYEVHNSDPIGIPYYIGDGGLKQFQSSLAFPPMNQKYGNNEINDIWGRFPENSLMGEVYHLRHMLAQTTDLIVCFVSSGFLFRASAGEKQFKQDMLDKNWLKAVISLPSNLLPTTTIPINVIVLDKAKIDNTVQFIDASDEQFTEKVARTRNKLIGIEKIVSTYQSKNDSKISTSVTATEIAENELNLSPSRYILNEEDEALNHFLQAHETAKLEDLVEIIRPQAVKHHEDGVHSFIEYNLASMNRIGSLAKPGKTINVKEADVAKVKKQQIQANDVLVVCKGAVGKVAIADGEMAGNAIASQSFAILRIKQHIDSISSEALFQYLVSRYGQLQLTSVTTGTTALMLSSKDLSMLQVPILNAETLNQAREIRKKIVDTYNTIEQLNDTIDRLNDSWL